MNDPLWSQLQAAFFRWLAHELAPYQPPPRPKPVSVTLLREDANMLVYGLTLPPPGAPDVVARNLTAIVNGTAADPVAATDGMELTYNDGDEVVLTLVDVDDAGNASQPSEPLSFKASDTLPPPQPGTLGVTVLREE